MKKLSSNHNGDGATPNASFSFKDKLLILRYARLGHLPPAQYATEILQEHGFPCLVVEFGQVEEAHPRLSHPFAKVRLANRWVRNLPRRVRHAAIFGGTLIQLVLRVLREGRPKLIVLHGLQEKCLGLILHALFRIPIAVHEHEVFEPNELTGINRLFFRVGIEALRRSEFLIFPEVSRAQIYKERYGLKAPIHLVFNCPRLTATRATVDLRGKLGLPRNAILMTYFGGVGYVNALEEAITAVLEVPRVYFLIWGWGQEAHLQALKELAQKMGVAGRVLFLGILENKWEVLGDCDLSYCVYRPLILRLKYAATASNKLMESLASGLPVITTGESDFRAIVEGYDVGVCLDKISSSAVATALKALVNDEIATKRKSTNGVRAFLTRFNYENQFEPMLTEFGRYFDLPTAKPLKQSAP